jgi:hypothetical protein
MVSMDINVEPRHDVPLWSETRWNGCWNPEQGVGLYLHVGRCRTDLDMWWAQVVAYLPGRRLVVDRRFGRSTNTAGVTLEGFELAMTPSGWTARFDSVAQLTTIDELALRDAGSSTPLAPVTFEVQAIGRQREWDMYAGDDNRLDFAGDTHVQQGFSTRGALRVGGEHYSLQGIGFKDHSSGPRDFSRWHRHHFMMLVHEDWTCHAVRMLTPDGGGHTLGAMIRDGVQMPVTRFELPELEDSAGGPTRGDAVIEVGSSERLSYSSELVHALPMLMTMDNDYVNGVDWRLEADPVVLIEGKGRLTAADGSVVHCFHERSARRSLVTRPDRLHDKLFRSL